MPQQLQYTRRNVLALGADFAFFAVGFVFWDPTVVIPSFVQELTGSTIAVGLLAALRILMLTLPQLWAASYLVGKPRKKPLLVWSSVGGRVPLLLLALATLFWAQRAAWLVAALLGLTFAAFYTSEGLNSIS